MKKFIALFILLGTGIIFSAQMTSAAGKTEHSDYAKLDIKECNSCHKSEGIVPNHGSDFIRDHRVLASKTGTNCKACHEQKYCLDCHTGGMDGTKLSGEQFGRDFKPKSHRSDFISLHPMKAIENPQQCNRCHDSKAFCSSCHDRYPSGRMTIKSHLRVGNTQTFLWKSEHSTEARRNLMSCAACHQDGDVCLKCHSAKIGSKISPHPRNFKGGNIKARSDKTCRTCH